MHNEIWVFVSKNNSRKGFLALGSSGNFILGPRVEKVGPPCFASLAYARREEEGGVPQKLGYSD